MSVLHLLAMFLGIATLSMTQVNASTYAKVDEPLNETAIVLMFHREKIAGKPGTYELVAHCESEAALKNCPNIQLLRTFKPDDKGIKGQEVLGTLNAGKMPALLKHLVEQYDSSYNPSPMILGTASGFILGVAMGELGWALTLGGLGLVVDIVKLPLSLPYTLVSKIHRMDQKRRLKKRFQSYVENKRFKPTRILGNMQFHALANLVLDFCVAHGANR